MWMQTDNYLGLRSRVADPNAPVPRVINICITSTSTTSEPRTAATATADFAGFPHGAAFGTDRTVGRCRRG